MRRILLAMLVVMLVGAGCIKPRPRTGPQAAAPLDVPPPPERVIAPPEPEQLIEETTPEEPEPAKDRPATRPGKPRPARERIETAKPTDAKPEATPPVVEAAKPPAPPPVAPLQPQLPASTQEVTKQVETQLAQARRDLDKVHYQGLSADARTQYDSARQFIAQATTALRDGNLVFAVKLAEKAVGLSSSLVPR